MLIVGVIKNMMIDISSSTFVLSVFILLLGIAMAYCLYSMFTVLENDKSFGVLVSVVVFMIFVVAAIGVICEESHDNAMQKQAIEDFNKKHVDIDLYYDDDVYKETIDKEFTRATVHNNSVELIDFMDGD